MDKFKAFSSVNCKFSHINDIELSNKTKDDESDQNPKKVKGAKGTDKYLVHIIMNRLKSMILEIDEKILEIKESNCKDNDFESYTDILLKLDKRYPLNDEDLKEIDLLTTQLSLTDIDREDYLERNFKLINILSGYLISDDYSLKNKQVEKYLQDNYFNKELYPPLNQFKDNLILDLDETLIHSEYPIDENKSYTFKLEDQNIGVFVRSYLKEFLEEISKEYNLVLFSAGISDYVNSVIDLVGIREYFSLVLTRECCCSPHNNIYIKDISVISSFLNDKLKYENNISCTNYSKETIIVDNNLISFTNDLNKGILVNDFLGKPDKELIDLYSLLIKLKNAKEDSNVSIEFLLHKVNNFVPKFKQTLHLQ